MLSLLKSVLAVIVFGSKNYQILCYLFSNRYRHDDMHTTNNT